jgi:hypothetical protein
MKLRHLISSALVLALAVPLAVAVYAVEDCCYGTTCPSVSNCWIQFSDPGPWQCKTTCPESCTQDDGCCQFRVRTCHYVKVDPRGPDCPSDKTEVIDVTWNSQTHCYAPGGGYEPCTGTNTNATCMQ